ncbi:MAG: hypothetical protein HY324_00175 [Chlamydiia bacterium]|nr:hypothetical protein [Chlamydiia bacterium]
MRYIFLALWFLWGRVDREEGRGLYERALAAYAEQDIDHAFADFLQALTFVEKKTPSSEEMHLYEEAYGEYLKLSGGDPERGALTLLEKYETVAFQHPEYVCLHFLLATAYANLGRYEEFFQGFYRGYPYLVDSSLAYKTQGVLWLRRAHRSGITQERAAFQKEAWRLLTFALERSPQDAGLYKVLIFLAKDEKKEELLLSYLEGIVKNKVILPRSDLYLYVRECVSLGAQELGQQMVNQAKEHYAYSRALLAAQEYLDEQRTDSR